MVLMAISPRCVRRDFHVSGGMAPIDAIRVSSATMRARISAAALRVKVIASTRRGSTPLRSRFT